ncbi:hypothetical protein [Pseudomonas guariconensis]|uniref:DUF2513 domain-containing protein n=1 Tax=Pseudomonas guariconensis TaxID=1288410 RepID=A0AAX0VNV0_9PSED|nr:hypothetical protein [Pseudomonas guariconensis]PLV08111.1 hypothetical protein CXG49_26280 [Pseudomonas guariconensis]PLV19064.1 hypothetical protein CXG53_26270 [Pseudomonas guariconensis]PLV25391.1 hypothetical protein CXG51_26300 [Pseudomonas guariconensis]
MTTSNIQQFDEITGQVLGALYENFPVPRHLLIKQFIEDGYSFNEQLAGDFANERGEFFLACVEWLAEAGYLCFKDQSYGNGVMNAVLTAKGLEALKAVPKSLTSGPSLGDQLVDATKSGTKSILGSLAGEVLSVGSRLVTTHFGIPG